jgi:hypothetical protein
MALTDGAIRQPSLNRPALPAVYQGQKNRGHASRQPHVSKSLPKLLTVDGGISKLFAIDRAPALSIRVVVPAAPGPAAAARTAADSCPAASRARAVAVTCGVADHPQDRVTPPHPHRPHEDEEEART